MKQTVKQLVTHPLISGSAIVFIGSNIGNLFAALFSFVLGRLLINSEFGVLSSLNSLITLPLLVASGLTPIVVNYAAEYFAKDSIDLVHGFYIKIAKLYVLSCSVLLILFFITLPEIATFFHIKDMGIIFLAGVASYIGLLTTINLSFLQAKLSFVYLAIISSIASVSKFLIGLVLVFLGFGAAGGIWGIFISSIIFFILSFYPLRFILSKKAYASPIPNKELLHFGIPTALSVLGSTAFITSDLFLVKHFFSADMAGIYAKLALIAKIIFFLTSSIAMVMYPMVVQKRSKNEDYTSTFLIGLLLVGVPSVAIVIGYYLFPSILLNLLFKDSHVTFFAPILWIFGMFLALYSVIAYLINFYLSLKKTKIVFPILLCAVLQVILIWNFHASFYQVILVSLTGLLLLLLSLLLYYPHATKK